jgi:hypothetical protein
VRRFNIGDFIAVYGTYAAVGCVLFGGALAVRGIRGQGPSGSLGAFFLICQSVGFALGTAGDVYGPYWFVPLYFATQCATIASLVHLAISFPQPLGVGSRWRHVAIAVVYGAALSLAWALIHASADVSLFVPLLYVVYLLLANAIFLYLAALATGFLAAGVASARAHLGRALAGSLAVVVLPAVLFLIYPILQRSIPPLVLVGPLIVFPLMTVTALPRERSLEAARASTSVRLRLSLLFLGAVQTSFLIAVAVFWQNNSWAQLLDDLTLNQQQRVNVRLLEQDPSAAAKGIAHLETRYRLRGDDLATAAQRRSAGATYRVRTASSRPWRRSTTRSPSDSKRGAAGSRRSVCPSSSSCCRSRCCRRSRSRSA